jgi:hypothetical protein
LPGLGRAWAVHLACREETVAVEPTLFAAEHWLQM